MKKLFVLATSLFVMALNTKAQSPVVVGGAAMFAEKNIIENAVNSRDHTTLVAAVKSAGLVDALSGAGPFTVFAPTNAAFDMLPKGTVENLLKSENRMQLQNVLKYHVVQGKWSASELIKMIRENKGKAAITTLTGESLYATQGKDGTIWLWDGRGGKAMVTISDVNQKNGVIHVIDHVLLPKM